MATKTYKPKRKISATESEEIKIPASSVDGLSTVATSGSYNDLSNKPTIPSATEVVQATGTSTTAVMSQKATTDELAKKANLDGDNDFYGVQAIWKDGIEKIELGDEALFGVDEELANFSVNAAQINLYTNSFKFSGQSGTAGQVLTSQGAGKTPIWADVSGGGSSDNSKHGYTQLTNEDLNTITEVGWYRAGANNTCTHKPSGVSTFPFVLMVEKSTDQNIKQTLYPILNSAISLYESHIRYYIDSSWSTWSKQQTMGDGQTQTFSGRKTFGSGINLTSSLQVGGSSGTAGQVLTSTGSGTPQWKTPSGGGSGDSVASVVDLTGTLVGGNSYTVFGNSEKGSFIGIINCEYNTSAGDFEFEINEEILTFTPTSQDVTLRVTIDRMYSNSVYKYYYTIVASDKSIDTSGFFTDTYTTMSISTSLGSSYYQGGVGVIIKKAV